MFENRFQTHRANGVVMEILRFNFFLLAPYFYDEWTQFNGFWVKKNGEKEDEESEWNNKLYNSHSNVYIVACAAIIHLQKQEQQQQKVDKHLQIIAYCMIIKYNVGQKFWYSRSNAFFRKFSTYTQHLGLYF